MNSVACLTAAVLSLLGATDNAAFEELRAAVRAAYQQREDLLLQSRGSVALSIEVRRSPEQLKSMTEGYSGQFGLDPEKLRLEGRSGWTVKWYKSGNKLRYDVNVPAPPPGNDHYLPANDMRIATDTEKSVYYDVANNAAYINLPPTKAENLAALTRCFDVSKLYLFMGKPLADQIDGILKYPGDIEVVPENVGGVDCLRLNYTSTRDNGAGRTAVKKGHWVFAPAMGFSLVAAQFRTERFFNGQPAGTSSANYVATYTESVNFPGVWLIKAARIQETGFPGTEVLTADFEETQIGETIPDAVFSFEGMGVPYGTLLHDKRLPGLGIDYVYSAGQTISLDDISIAPDGNKLMENLEPATVEMPEEPPAEPPAPPERAPVKPFRWQLPVAAFLLVCAAMVGTGVLRRSGKNKTS